MLCTNTSGAGAPRTQKKWGRRAIRFLLARTLRFEMQVCAHCGGKMRMVAAIEDPVSKEAYLEGVGLPSSAPDIAPARPPPQEALDYYFDDA